MTDEVVQIDRGDVAVVLRAMRQGPLSGGQLAERTGWSRNTVRSRVDALIASRWVIGADEHQGERGRPSTRYRVNPTAAHIFVAIFGWDHLHGAICDLDGAVVVERTDPISSDRDYHGAPDLVAAMLDALLSKSSIPRERVAVAVAGIPSPVANPNLVRDWGLVDLAATGFSERLGMPVCVENDVNLMALGARRDHPGVRSLVFVKMATFIGAGILVNSRLHAGNAGLAGEIGHIPVRRGGTVPCMCGNRGCLAMTAGIGAILEAVSRPERPANSLDDLRDVLADGDSEAVVALRHAGRDVGEALVGLVVGLAPEIVVVGGAVARLGDNVTIGIRESIDRLALPALSSRLRIITSPDHRRAGIHGAADLAFDRLFPGPVDVAV